MFYVSFLFLGIIIFSLYKIVCELHVIKRSKVMEKIKHRIENDDVQEMVKLINKYKIDITNVFYDTSECLLRYSIRCISYDCSKWFIRNNYKITSRIRISIEADKKLSEHLKRVERINKVNNHLNSKDEDNA